jgi:hypothetical protein
MNLDGAKEIRNIVINDVNLRVEMSPTLVDMIKKQYDVIEVSDEHVRRYVHDALQNAVKNAEQLV